MRPAARVLSIALAKRLRSVLGLAAVLTLSSCPAPADVLFNGPIITGAGFDSSCANINCLDGLTTQMFISPPLAGFCISAAPAPPTQCLQVENGEFRPDGQGTVIKLTAASFPNFAALVSDLTDQSGWQAGLLLIAPNSVGPGGFGAGIFRAIGGRIDEVDFSLVEFCVSDERACENTRGIPFPPEDYVIEVNVTVLGTPVPEPPPTGSILIGLAVLSVATIVRRECFRLRVMLFSLLTLL